MLLLGVFYYESQEKADRCFYITYKIGRTKRREKIGWRSEGYNAQIAANIRAERLQQIRHGKEIVRKITFKEGMDKYLESIEEKPSYKLNKTYLIEAAKFFGYSTNIANISSIQIIAYINHLKSIASVSTHKKLSNQTITHYYKAVRQVYNFVCNTGLYGGHNPINKTTGASLPKVSRASNVHVFSAASYSQDSLLPLRTFSQARLPYLFLARVFL